MTSHPSPRLKFRTLGIAVVTKNGKEISRLRGLGRAAIAWLAILASAVILPLVPILAARFTKLDFDRAVWYSLCAGYALALLWLAGIAYAIVRPARGLQDRIARTFLVPRQ